MLGNCTPPVACGTQYLNALFDSLTFPVLVQRMPGFLDEAEIAQVLKLVPPAGAPAWQPCDGDAHNRQIGKTCATLNLDDEGRGPAAGIIERMASLWDDEQIQRLEIDMFRYAPGHGPTHLHRDFTDGDNVNDGEHTGKSSVVLYLTAPGGSNGAATNWPSVGVRSVPQERSCVYLSYYYIWHSRTVQQWSASTSTHGRPAWP